jgi:transmembrane sensor
MTGRSDIDEIEATAAAWDVRLRQANASDRERAAFRVWSQGSPEHAAAYDRLQMGLSLLRAQPELPELSALRDEARGSIRRFRSRRVAAIVSALAACLLVTVGVGLQTERGSEIAAVLQGGRIYRTALNERSKVTLADGSVLTLDSGTRLSARLRKSRRDITLMSGRALFQVAKDAQRPFIVRAGDRTVTALGTVFDVRLAEGKVRVTLVEGRVAVRPVQAGRIAPATILEPKQQLVETTEDATLALRTVDTDKALSWMDGQVFFDNETLETAASEMNQYSRAKIVVDPSVANLRINGMFRTGNQTGFAGALQTTLPVEVRTDDQGRILVSKRAEAAAPG